MPEMSRNIAFFTSQPNGIDRRKYYGCIVLFGPEVSNIYKVFSIRSSIKEKCFEYEYIGPYDKNLEQKAISFQPKLSYPAKETRILLKLS